VRDTITAKNVLITTKASGNTQKSFKLIERRATEVTEAIARDSAAHREDQQRREQERMEGGDEPSGATTGPEGEGKERGTRTAAWEASNSRNGAEANRQGIIDSKRRKGTSDDNDGDDTNSNDKKAAEYTRALGLLYDMILSTGKALRGGGQPQVHTTAAYRRADQRWGPTTIRQEMIIQGWSLVDSVLQSDGRIKEDAWGQIEEAIGEALSRDTEIGEHQGGSEGEEGKGTDEEEEEDDQMSESGDESESEGEDESEVETEEQREERVEYVRTETERRRDQQEGKSTRKKQQRRDGAVETAAEKAAKDRAKRKRDIYKRTKVGCMTMGKNDRWQGTSSPPKA